MNLPAVLRIRAQFGWKGLKTVADKGRINSWSVFRIILLPCMVLCTITKKPVFQWLALAALAVWVVIEICRLADKVKRNRKEGRRAVRNTDRKKNAKAQNEDKSLLLQVNYRITEQLRSAYPGITWLWLEKPGQEEIKRGGTWRISIQNADPFNFAEISLRSSGAMEIALIQISPFSEPVKEPEPDSCDLDQAELLDRFDVRQWYSDTGEAVLSGLVDELNTQGYKQLLITEDGNVTISVRGSERSFSSIGELPPKSAWEDLCVLLRADDIRASVSGSQLALAW